MDSASNIKTVLVVSHFPHRCRLNAKGKYQAGAECKRFYQSHFVTTSFKILGKLLENSLALSLNATALGCFCRPKLVLLH